MPPWLWHPVFVCQFVFNLATKGIETGSGGNHAGQKKKVFLTLNGKFEGEHSGCSMVVASISID